MLKGQRTPGKAVSMEWRAYLIENGGSCGSVGDDTLTEEQAQRIADELFGEGATYVVLKEYF